MSTPQAREQSLIDSIIELELEMFLAVKNAGGTASCQEREGSFKAMRWMVHSVFPAAYLESYLSDLRLAKDKGLNLMTIKYGRMDGQIERYNESPLIDDIVEAECAWMRELRQSSPQDFRSTDTEHFRRYLSSELETLSDRTLAIYKRVVDAARQTGRNLARERYANMREKLDMAGV